MFKLLLPFLRPNSGCAFSQAGTLVLRLAAGLFIAGFHGWPKLLQGIAHVRHGDAWPLLEGITLFGLPFPTFWAFAATATYVISGLFVAAGFLTRFAALDLLGTVLMAVYANSRLGRDTQLMMLYAAVFASFVLIGGARYSIDAVLFGRAARRG
jgi:putative oxidoreductase